MRKAQVYSQIFIYLLTVVIVSLIIVFGYKAIKNFKDRAEQVSCIKFRNEVKSAVTGLLGDYGSVKIMEFHPCSGTVEVCFAETKDEIPQAEFNNIRLKDPIIEDSLADKTGKNVFLRDKVTKESFEIGNISVHDNDNTPNLLCINSPSRKIIAKLESFGNYVKISEP
jgi:hypothetical protein